MSDYGLGWVDVALAQEEENARLAEENRELRLLLTDLVLAIGRNADLLAFARGEIEERFGEAA